MVRFGVGLIVVTVIFLSLERQMTTVTTFKQEESWIGTGLKTQDIAGFYQNFSCKNTQKNYLACVNSLESMASYLDMELSWSADTGLQLRASKVVDGGENQKTRLSSWLSHFKQNKHLSMNFEGIWRQIEKRISAHRYSSYIVGIGINDYLSVSRDPHSYILPKEYYEKVVANSQPRISSYGFAVGKIDADIVFARVYPESLFDKLGVAKGDVLLELDGKSIKNMSVESVSDLLRRKDQHKFKVKSQGKISVWNLSKKDQVLPSVSMKRLPRENDRVLHLISVFKISEGVCKAVEKNLQQVNREKSGGVILDLRDNSGGSMDEVLCISGLFVGDKKIYDLVYFNKRFRSESFYSGREAEYMGPLVVLVNRSTASSAEILSGVIQHYGRGMLVGERTFGKGSFQEGEVWAKNKNMLYFQTKGTFHLPSGQSPQLLGITPDIEIAETIASASRREEDLYLYPVGNGQLREKVSKRVASVRECRAVPKEVLTADRLLGKALVQIDCIQF